MDKVITIKPTVLLMAPVNTRSGYGARSRDIAHALIDMDKYDVMIWPTKWGNTPMNALDSNNERDKRLIDRILVSPNLPSQPDIFIQVTVPNEFQRIGRFNIGITAGIETTIASAPWIEGCNRMDLILVSSQHSKNVLQGSGWVKHDSNTHQPMGEIKLEKPIEVLFEGVDLTKYFKTPNRPQSIDAKMEGVSESFCFLFTGHWLAGDLGEDRKNISGLIRTFLDAFKNVPSHKRPALILKTSSADFSKIDRELMISKINQIRDLVGGNLPSIYLLHGDLTDEEMNGLYNHPKIKAHITFTKGEGFGRPLAEASLSEKPIIASNWSGHLDFIKDAVLLPGQLTKVHPSAAWKDVILEESQWMTVDYGYAVRVLKSFVDEYGKDMKKMGANQASYVRDNFSLESMGRLLDKLLDQYAPPMPKQVKLNLPKLKKIGELNETNV